MNRLVEVYIVRRQKRYVDAIQREVGKLEQVLEGIS
jgi:hypothetical protein